MKCNVNRQAFCLLFVELFVSVWIISLLLLCLTMDFLLSAPLSSLDESDEDQMDPFARRDPWYDELNLAKRLIMLPRVGRSADGKPFLGK